MKANSDIRTAAKENGVFLWEVARYIGVADTTLNRRMRNELPAKEKAIIFTAISKLKEVKNNAANANN